MSSGSRPVDPPSTTLLMRVLEQPGLVAAVRDMPGAELAALLDRIGLEDAAELVALASTEQLERLFDGDLWRAERAGGDETFRPERFVSWLRVLGEAGESVLARRLAELPQDLLALAVHRLVLVLDMDVVEEQLSWAGDEAAPVEQALESSVFEEWEEFRLIAREPDAWDDLWNALLSLDRDHHHRLRAILEQCCAMSTEYISGQGGLYQVLTSAESLEENVAAARDDRRAADGFVSPADARAFLELARRGGASSERDAITRAYFRALPQPEPALEAAARNDRETGARAAPPEVRALAGRTRGVAPLFEQAMNELRQRDQQRFLARVREVGYLVNVWMAGGDHDGRRPRAVEALETVLGVCEAGLRAELEAAEPGAQPPVAVLARTPADALFRRGFGSSPSG